MKRRNNNTINYKKAYSVLIIIVFIAAIIGTSILTYFINQSVQGYERISSVKTKDNKSYSERGLNIKKRTKIKKTQLKNSSYGRQEKNATMSNITNKTSVDIELSNKYPIHKNITATVFWVGEGSSSDNGYIQNYDSVWDDKWMEHYGGVDDPENRNGYYPAEFTPKENPFYVALPYNDFDEEGVKKKDKLYWSSKPNESACKNRWVKIIRGNITVYAQWEDAGPFGEDDYDYVFGNNTPKNKINNNAGIDVSPAVRDYLNMSDIDKVDWQFVDFEEVPDGPWKKIITTSNIYWE